MWAVEPVVGLQLLQAGFETILEIELPKPAIAQRAGLKTFDRLVKRPMRPAHWPWHEAGFQRGSFPQGDFYFVDVVGLLKIAIGHLEMSYSFQLLRPKPHLQMKTNSSTDLCHGNPLTKSLHCEAAALVCR